MRICVYGAGAIGGFIGARLAQAGEDVTLIARGAHLAAMRERGLRLLADGKETTLTPKTAANAGEAGEQDYLDVLSDIVERYESEAHPMKPLEDAAMLRHLLEAKAITQTQLSQETGIDQTTLSLVLSGKRDLSRGHINKLARNFGVSPSVFKYE